MSSVLSFGLRGSAARPRREVHPLAALEDLDEALGVVGPVAVEAGDVGLS